MSDSRFVSTAPAPAATSSPYQRQSLGLIDRPCTESELLQYVIEGEAARQELDQQAAQLISLAQRSAAAACLPAVVALEDRKEFLTKLGNQMREPLNSILAMTDVLRSKPLPKLARDCVEEMSRSGVALSTIVDDLLNFLKKQ